MRNFIIKLKGKQRKNLRFFLVLMPVLGLLNNIKIEVDYLTHIRMKIKVYQDGLMKNGLMYVNYLK